MVVSQGWLILEECVERHGCTRAGSSWPGPLQWLEGGGPGAGAGGCWQVPFLWHCGARVWVHGLGSLGGFISLTISQASRFCHQLSRVRGPFTGQVTSSLEEANDQTFTECH